MLTITKDNESVFDVLEAMAEYNTLPEDRRREPTIIQFCLDKSRWFSMLALKAINYKGLGEFLIIEPDAVVAKYKNIQVVYNGVETQTYDSANCADMLRAIRDWSISPNTSSGSNTIRVSGTARRSMPAHGFAYPQPVAYPESLTLAQDYGLTEATTSTPTF